MMSHPYMLMIYLLPTAGVGDAYTRWYRDKILLQCGSWTDRCYFQMAMVGHIQHVN